MSLRPFRVEPREGRVERDDPLRPGFAVLDAAGDGYGWFPLERDANDERDRLNVEIPDRLFPSEDFENTLKFTDSGVEIDGFTTLVDKDPNENVSVNEIAVVHGGANEGESWVLASEIARRYNTHKELRDFVERVDKGTWRGGVVDLMNQARALLKKLDS